MPTYTRSALLNTKLPTPKFRSVMLISFALLAFTCSDEVARDATTEAQPESATEARLFERLPPEQTGITFSNNIVEDAEYNHFRWQHVYSGSGVAVGDINNDGLQDLFFGGNQATDKLYLNKGDLKFEEITKSAGIRQEDRWSMGVSMVDINQDGFLDIYVCRNDPTMDFTQRKNRCYINNGDNTFTDKAPEMGLADMGFSIQATFFDYDQDGDLDCYVVNQPPDARFIDRFQLDMNDNRFQWTDHFYLNRGDGTFQDITRHSGIENFAYGLNVVASDLNGDGWTDVYVTNDYFEPDFFYLNQGDGTFKDAALDQLGHISNFSMGSDVGDFNNDGLPDLGVVDMAAPDHFRSKTNMASMRPDRFWNLVNQGYHYQYMSNTLQLNTGMNRFSEVGFQAGIAKTDWSWSFLMADFDNDGFRDISVTNGIQRDMRNNDFQMKIRKANANGQREFKISEVLPLIPSQPVANYMFKNPGRATDGSDQLHFTDVTKAWGFYHPGFSNGMAIADLDNDGDLDVVINNVSEPASVYQNIRGNEANYLRIQLGQTGDHVSGFNARVIINYGDDELQFAELTPVRGYLSASEVVAHFGLSKVDKVDQLTVHWNNGKTTVLTDVKVNQLLVIDQNTPSDTPVKKAAGKPIFAELKQDLPFSFRHQENEFDDFSREILLPHKQSEHGPHLSVADVNGDGLDDVFIGGAMNQAASLQIQQADGSFDASQVELWKQESPYEDLGSLFFDADNDNDLDLYVVSGGTERPAGDPMYQDRLYLNDGKGNFTAAQQKLPEIQSSGERVVAADVDSDGDQDLFVGGRIVPGKYPAPAASLLLINENGSFRNATEALAPELIEAGLITDALFTDYDQDNDPDLMIVGEWSKVRVFRNDDGQFSEQTDALGLDQSTAWWWSVAEADLDGDGDPDYLLGNLGKNTKYKASTKKPLMVYANDFDANGTNDVVLASYNGEEVVPVRGRECSSEQMPFIAEKFESYEDFATANLEAILPEEELEQAVSHEVYSFASGWLENKEGSFDFHPFPDLAQVGPIRDITSLDLNGDGHLDVIGTGNMYASEVETSRYDAGTGLILLNDGQGNLRNLPARSSGWFTPFDARSMATVEVAGKGKLFLVGNNRAPVQFFQPLVRKGK